MRWILSRAALLDDCELLADLLHGFAGLLGVGALMFAAYEVRPGTPERPEEEPDLAW